MRIPDCLPGSARGCSLHNTPAEENFPRSRHQTTVYFFQYVDTGWRFITWRGHARSLTQNIWIRLFYVVVVLFGTLNCGLREGLMASLLSAMGHAIVRSISSVIADRGGPCKTPPPAPPPAPPPFSSSSSSASSFSSSPPPPLPPPPLLLLLLRLLFLVLLVLLLLLFLLLLSSSSSSSSSFFCHQLLLLELFSPPPPPPPLKSSSSSSPPSPPPSSSFSFVIIIIKCRRHYKCVSKR